MFHADAFIWAFQFSIYDIALESFVLFEIV